MTPSLEAIYLAAEWLDVYEGTDNTQDDVKSCRDVAEWLRGQAEKLELKKLCKEYGVPYSAVSKRVKRENNQSS